MNTIISEIKHYGQAHVIEYPAPSEDKRELNKNINLYRIQKKIWLSPEKIMRRKNEWNVSHFSSDSTWFEKLIVLKK